MFRLLAFLAAITALSFASLANAHSTLRSSTPANGATVSEAKTISLTFTQQVRLVTLKLTGKGVDTALPVDRAAPAATSFSTPLPAVAAGAYKVAWTATAADGHIMTGAFSFTIAAAATQP